MKQNWIVIGLSFVVLVAVFFVTFRLHRESEREVLVQFGEHQVADAEHFADKIKSFFWGHSIGMERTASVGSTGGMAQIRADIEAHFEEMSKDYVEAVCLYDETGRMIYSTRTEMIDSGLALSQFFAWAKDTAMGEEVFVSPLFPAGEGEQRKEPNRPAVQSGQADFKVILAVPLYGKARETVPSGEKERMTGILSLTLDLKRFLAAELQDLQINLHEVWLIDREGKLLFQSVHPDMVSRNIFRRDESCNRCHSSFDYAEKILKEQEGVIRYGLREGGPKIAGFASMEFGNASWRVVVNTRQDRVTGFFRKNLRGHLLLLGIVTLFFIASSVVYQRNARSRLKTEEESKYLHLIINERKKLSSQILTAQETERRRISRELHDELGGALSLFKLRLNFIKKHLRDSERDLLKECDDCLHNVDGIIESVHRLSWDLSPAILEDLGLSAALRWLIGNFSKKYKIETTFEGVDLDALFPKDAQLVLYRLFQEILTNIEKHAEAQTISVAVRREDGKVSFSIEDNGKGIDPVRLSSANGSRKGLGLAIMKERVEMLEGVIDIVGIEGKGTRITIDIPITKKGTL